MQGRALLWLGCGFVLAGCAPQETENFSATPRRELTAKEKTLLADTIKGALKDPNSAMIDYLPMPAVKSQVISYCALVNAKNALGGYVGRMPAEIAVKAADSGEIVAAKLAGISGGPNEAGVDPWLSRCQTLGYLPA